MKGRSIIEAVVVFSVLQIVLLLPDGVRSLVRWENRAFGGSYFTGVLMVALGLFMIIFRRYEFNEIGVTTENWRTSVNYGARGWIFFMIPQFILSFILAWGVSYKDSIELAGLLGGIVVIATFFMARRNEAKPVTNTRLLVIVVVLLSPLVFRLIYEDFSMGLLKEFIWNILVGGFAEEFFYRGYIQSSINNEYTRDWKLGKINFGPGLLVSSLLYGLSRGLRTIKPWRGAYPVSWSWTLFAFTVSFFYGLIRESSGDIIGSGTANSLIDAIGEAIVS
jgi:membrane protease YdiL (CAAX protease family)